MRRSLNALLGRFLTRTDVVFEEALAAALRVLEERPSLLGARFRFITLEKAAPRT